MNSSARRFFLITCVAIAGCMPDPQRAASVASDSIAIVALRQQFQQAVRDGDVEGLVAVLDSAVINMPPNGDPQVGLEQVRRWAEPRFTAPRPDATYEVTESRIAGDWAFERGSYGTQELGTIGKRIWIFRRQPERGWRISHIMWSSNARPPARP